MSAIYTRNKYHAPQPASGLTRQGPPLEAFLHHTTDADGLTFNTRDEQVRKVHAIDRQHKGQGWSMIGYHWIVFQRTGDRNQSRAFQARSAMYVPAAQAGHNTRTLAIAVVGNGERETLFADTEDCISRILGMYKQLRRMGGHRDVVATACPGDRFYRRVPAIARRRGLDVM